MTELRLYLAAPSQEGQHNNRKSTVSLVSSPVASRHAPLFSVLPTVAIMIRQHKLNVNPGKYLDFA